MSNLYRVFRYEFSRNVRRRAYLFTTFALPVLLIVIGGFLFQSGTQTVSNNPSEAVTQTVEALGLDDDVNAGYVDEAGLIIEEIDNEQMRRFPDEASARAAIENGEVEGVYIIPPDFLETGDVRMLVPTLSLSQISSSPVANLVMNSLGTDIDMLLFARLQNPGNFNKINVDRAIDPVETTPDDPVNDVIRNEETDFAVAYVFVMLFLLTIFATNGYLMQSVIEEKESRLIEILISSVRPMQLLTGKIMAMAALGILQIVVWIVIGFLALQTQPEVLAIIRPVLSSLNIPISAFIIMAIYFVLGYVMFASFFGGIGAISQSLQEGPQFTVILVLPAMIPLYLMPALIGDPNGSLAVGLSMFPLTAPLTMLIRLSLTEVPFYQVALSIGILAVCDVFFFWALGRLFRVQTLLSGQPPKIRELPKLIFGS